MEVWRIKIYHGFTMVYSDEMLPCVLIVTEVIMIVFFPANVLLHLPVSHEDKLIDFFPQINKHFY